MPKSKLLFLLFLVLGMLSFNNNINGQILNFNNTVPTDVTVCESAESFTVEFTNALDTALENPVITLQFPSGVEYQIGSLSESSVYNVQESNTSNLSEVEFSMDDLPGGATATFTIEAEANFTAYTRQLAGNTFSNQVLVTFTDGADSSTTGTYNILYPALSITSVSPSSATVFVGGTYTRTVTIVNGGYGSTSSVVLRDDYDSNISLVSTDIGTLNVDKNEITLNSTDFLNIGDGDGLFDQNESITITQTISAEGCTSTQDTITAFWGCDGETSASNIKYPYTTVNLYAPDLSVTSTGNFGTCVDGPDAQQLMIINDGTGPANAAEVVITPLNQSQYTRIDASSISYTMDGTTTALTPTATQNASSYDCFGSSPIDGFTVSLPVIGPGDTLYLDWNNYTCQATSCGNVRFVGWDYDGTYTDMCTSQTYSFDGRGQDAKRKNMTAFYESPSDLLDGQTGTYSLMITSSTFDMPEGTGAYIEAVVDVPLGLTWNGSSSDVEYVSGQYTWSSSQIDYDSNTRELKVRYPFPIPDNFGLDHSQFNVDLDANCAEASGLVTLAMQLNYIMDSTCASPYPIALTCKEYPQTQIHCTGPCTEGLVFNSFEISRTSFGISDNDVDGLPDGVNSLDMTKVKANRMMVSDTFETVFKGTIKTSVTNPDWSYAYASSDVPNGNDIDIISASISVYDVSSGQTLTCSSVPYTSSVSGGVKTVDFDFSPATLVSQGCTDFTGFTFSEGDSIELVPNYKVVGNIGGAIEQAQISNEFYVSDTQNGTAYSCNDWNGNFTMIGYFYRSNSAKQYNVKSCEITIQQNYYMSIGRCCDNYSGGNLFPYEYRNWSYLKDLRVEIPSGYTFVSGTIDQWRTRSTNRTTKETDNITPTSIDGISHNFDIEQYLVENGGSINASDDGFNGRISIVVAPDCDVNTSANNPMKFFFQFQENSVLGGSVTDELQNATDYLKYFRSKLTPSSTLPTQEGIGNTVTWDLKVKASVADAENGWMYLEDLDGEVTVTEVKRTSDDSVITPVNGLYQLGDMDSGDTENFEITATYSSCGSPSLRVVTGYDCSGYPSSYGEYSCSTEETNLYISPQPSELQVRFDSYTSLVDECDNTITVEVEMLSAKLASVQDLFVRVIQPSNPTITIESGSVEVLYPLSGSYSTISDPTLSNGIYTISGSDMDATISQNGLVGITDLTSNSVRLKFNIVLANDYEPGERVSFEIGGNRPCGDALPTLALAYDPNASFEKPENIGLSEISDAWATAWGDYDDDGDQDLFITNYDNSTPNYLYQNNGDSTFTRITTGIVATDVASSLAATWGDYDNDGDLDLYVANNIGYENFLYRNDGGTFTKILNDPIVTEKDYAHGASWVDVDNDGYLDMFVTDYFSTKFNKLYLNNGDGTFTKANGTSPTLEAGYSVSAAWGDYNGDGLPDLFVCNTDRNNNSLYKNTGNGNFLKINTGDIVSDGGNSVGASWGDYDNDGDLDLFVANSGNQNNFLYQNNGNETFTKITSGIIVTDGGHSHGSAWGDFDNDGDLDLFVSNDQNQDNFLYANNGDGTFSAVTNDVTQDDGMSFGAAWADYDNDGDLDLFVTNHQQNTNFVYKNTRGRCQSHVRICLVGTNSNRTAIGSKIRVKANVYGQDVWQMREISSQTGGGIGGQNDLRALFGLGDADIVDSIIVEWTSGYRQVLTNQAVNNDLKITEENASEVCGNVYYDLNNNCVQDTNEVGIPNLKITLQPGDYTAVTNDTGAYSILVPPGNYTITQDTTTSVWSPTCTAEHSVNVVGIGGQFCGNNFADTASCALPDLKVEISVTEHRVGFENLIALTYENNGTKTATGVELTLTLDDHVIPLESSIAWDDSSATELTWDLGDVGIGTAVTIFIVDSIGTDMVIGDNIQLSATITANESDCNASDNSDTNTKVAVGAIDPNDIAVSPEGYIENDQELIYKIRFQNVGNTIASTVIVEDQLPESLDPNTVQVGLVSHNYRFEVMDDNRLVWTFENINLIDSVANEEESHGFIFFKIRPKQNLEDGVVIENKAAIFFDNAAPVITNTVVNIIGEEPRTINTASAQLHFYPNPMSDQSAIQIIPLTGGAIRIQSLTIYNLFGKQVLQQTKQAADVFVIDRGNMEAGYFIVKAIGENGESYTGKLIIK